MTSDVLRVTTEARSGSLGPFSPSFNINQLLLENLDKFLPEDAHIRCSGKLHVSLTRVHDGKNVVVSQFDSREELIQILLASAFIPFFSGLLPPKFKGVRYMDGGCSDNLPTLDENTITVSPFCGESDICPRDDSSQLFHINVANTSIELSKHNIYRMVRILFPPKPEVLANMCKQGFDDALRFMHRNNLISCTRCVAVQSTFVVSEMADDNLEYDPQCKECKLHRQEALVSDVPDSVLSKFQEAVDKANNGLLSWLFKHRGMKLLSVLTLPYTLPADVMYATFTKLMVAAPQLGNGAWELSKSVLERFSQILNNVNIQRKQLSAKIICHLAITEYGGNKFDVESCQDVNENKVNLNFTLNLDDSDLPLSQSPVRKLKRKISREILQRTPNLIISRSDTMANDTFEHILQATSQQDTIMTYYYLDENNKVKVTEIFDASNSDSSIVQTTQERDVNKNFEFDNDWNESTYLSQSMDEYMSDYDFEDVIDRDSCTIFSDPESEWTGTVKVEEPEDEQFPHDHSETDHRPEAEQVGDDELSARWSMSNPSYKISSIVHERMDTSIN